MTAASPPVLAISGIEKTLGREPVLRGIDLTIAAGEVVCLMGPSGCGKSTLLRCIDLLSEPDTGYVRIDGEFMGIRPGSGGNRVREAARKTNAMRARIGMIFQQFHLWPHLTALGNVTKAQVVVLRRPLAEARARGIALLERVGLGDKIDAYPHELSNGQQQRVAIARALAMDPRIMLCDEPTASLDPELVQEVLAVLRQLAQDGMTMIIVTHELSFAAQVADRIAFMDQGRIVEIGSPTDIIERPKSERLRLFLSRLRRSEPSAAAAS